MTRINGKLDIILQAVVNRIISKIPSYTPATCYVSLLPDHIPPPSASKDFICVVSPPMQGNFDDAMMDGGGAEQATMHGDLIVTTWCISGVDEVRRDTKRLIAASTGLLERWRKTVAALTIFDPTDGPGNEQLRDPLMPSGFRVLKRKKFLGGISQNFRLTADLNLTLT